LPSILAEKLWPNETTLWADAETMIDWNLVEEMTLWNHEELIKRMSEVFSYDRSIQGDIDE
jgi:hypothetical protein